jgi:hypothetical protein
LAGCLLTTYQRSDVLAAYFSSALFGNARYSDVLARYLPDNQQGYVILNATDLGHEGRFPFTQNNFDLICSDLRSLKLADAVSASADFPIAFSAVGIKNASPCPAQNSAVFASQGPASWIAKYAKFDTGAAQRPDAGVEVPRPTDLDGMRGARSAQSHLEVPMGVGLRWPDWDARAGPLLCGFHPKPSVIIHPHTIVHGACATFEGGCFKRQDRCIISRWHTADHRPASEEKAPRDRHRDDDVVAMGVR